MNGLNLNSKEITTLEAQFGFEVQEHENLITDFIRIGFSPADAELAAANVESIDNECYF